LLTGIKELSAFEQTAKQQKRLIVDLWQYSGKNRPYALNNAEAKAAIIGQQHAKIAIKYLCKAPALL